MIRSLVGDRTNKKKGNLRIMKTLRCLLASVTPIATAVVLTAASTAFAGGGAECDITFRITTSTALRSASVFVIYQNAPGDFLGQTSSTECTNLTGTVGQAADADQTRTLTLTMTATPNPFNGPKDMFRCTWIPTTRFPVAGDFNLASQSGFDTQLPVPNQVNAGIIISDISCNGVIATTTTSSSTSTTTPEPTGACCVSDDNTCLEVTRDECEISSGGTYMGNNVDCDQEICLPTTTTTTTSSTTTSSSTTTTTLGPSCGDINGDGRIVASDALYVLSAAVDIVVCDDCLCDIDGGGMTSATDALLTLAAAVGVEVNLDCPVCEK
jgi:hypothetical protein